MSDGWDEYYAVKGFIDALERSPVATAGAPAVAAGQGALRGADDSDTVVIYDGPSVLVTTAWPAARFRAPIELPALRERTVVVSTDGFLRALEEISPWAPWPPRERLWVRVSQDERRWFFAAHRLAEVAMGVLSPLRLTEVAIGARLPLLRLRIGDALTYYQWGLRALGPGDVAVAEVGE